MCLADEKAIRSQGAPGWSVLMACSAEVDTCTLGVATKVLDGTSPILKKVPPPKLGRSRSGGGEYWVLIGVCWVSCVSGGFCHRSSEGE